MSNNVRLIDLKNWLKTKTDCGEAVTLGGIDANRERCIGIYARDPDDRGMGAHICLGGAAMTKTRPLYAEILIHWGRDAAAAEEKAWEIWALFAGLTDAWLGQAPVYLAQPGTAPLPRDRDGRGICEYAVRLTLWGAA